MIDRFDPARGPIVVLAEITGPLGKTTLRLLLDTGATQSLIDSELLEGVGLHPSAASPLVSVAMGNGVELIPLVVASRLKALGRNRLAFPVLSRALPADVNADGLLGLDFLRDQILTIDFPSGRISLT